MSSNVTDIEGDWKIVDYPQHPACVDSKIEIKGYTFDPNMFKVCVHVFNDLSCTLKHNSTTAQWEVSDFVSTDLTGSSSEMDKEHVFKKFILGLNKLELQNEQQLLMGTNHGDQVQMERLL